MQASLAEHRALMRALRRRDPEEAERVMRAHLMAQRAALAVQDAAPAAAGGARHGRGARAARARRGKGRR
jgi:DNA-binding FadR family transcriptional regulator